MFFDGHIFQRCIISENLKYISKVRYNAPPYDKIHPNNRALADDIFNHISIYHCNLFSTTS